MSIVHEKKSKLWWRLKAAAGHPGNAGNPKLCDSLKLLESAPHKRESRTSKVKSRTRGCKAHKKATSNTQQELPRKDLAAPLQPCLIFKPPARPQSQQHTQTGNLKHKCSSCSAMV